MSLVRLVFQSFPPVNLSMGQTQLFTSCFTTHSKYQQTAKLSILLGIPSSVQFKFHTVFDTRRKFSGKFFKTLSCGCTETGRRGFYFAVTIEVKSNKELNCPKPLSRFRLDYSVCVHWRDHKWINDQKVSQ